MIASYYRSRNVTTWHPPCYTSNFHRPSERTCQSNEGYSTTHQMLSTTVWPPWVHMSRNLDPYFFRGQGLNLGPITLQSSAQPLDHPRAPRYSIILFQILHNQFSCYDLL